MQYMCVVKSKQKQNNSGCPHSHDALLSSLDNEENMIRILYMNKIFSIFKYVDNWNVCIWSKQRIEQTAICVF